MTDFENETSVIHSFGVVPPLSMEEFEKFYWFAWDKGIALACEVDHENGPNVPFVAVLYGNWRLIEKELKRLGREFHKPVAARVSSAIAEVIPWRSAS